MLDIFGWLRRKAHDAVLGGIADAVHEVAAGEPADLERLRSLLAAPEAKAALPAAEPEEPAKRGRSRG